MTATGSSTIVAEYDLHQPSRSARPSGVSVIQSRVPIQRLQRDIQALANHAIMHPQTTTELYGRVLCGLEPNSLIV
jgi:hypothetical protein